jgi:transposase
MRYTSDLTDAEWHLIDYCFPKPCQTGRPREHSYRELLNGIFYLSKVGSPSPLKATWRTCSKSSGTLA